jgi:uncharacterized membrane protein YqjE
LAANNGKQESLAAAMTQVSEKVTVLIREEIELAKAEVTTKISSLSKGIVAGAIGAVLALLFIPFLLLTLAWVINRFTNTIWVGFVVVTVLLLVGMAVAFLIAWRKIKAAGNPAPTMAIDEAKKIRETVSKGGNGSAPKHSTVKDVVATAPAPAPVPAPPPPVAVVAPAEPATIVPAPAPAPPPVAETDAPAPDAAAPEAPAPDAPAAGPEDAG